jgi:hypothetical protein
MMTTRTRIAWLLLAAATLTTACGGGNTQAQVPIGSADPFPAGGASSSSAPATTSAAAPSSSAAPADAAGQALAALTRYNDVLNRLFVSGDLAELNTVASGIEITNRTNDINSTRASGATFQRGADLVNTAVGAIDSTKVPATVQITACVEGGVPTGQASSAPRASQKGRFYLTDASWPDPAGWRVSDSDLRGEPCTA